MYTSSLVCEFTNITDTKVLENKPAGQVAGADPSW